MSVILFCPAGRQPVLSIQLQCMKPILDLPLIHEYHIWNVAWNDQDREYVSTLESIHPKIKVKTTPYGNASRANSVASSQFSYFFHDYYKYAQYKDYIFVKLDDDIVFVDHSMFEQFIEGRKNSTAFLYSANVINNDHTNPHAFDSVHQTFLQQSTERLEKNRKKGVVLFSHQLRLSINFVAFMGSDLCHINDEFSNGIGSNDEWRLCHEIPKRLGRENEIALYMSVVHYAFGGHIHHTYLNAYHQLVNTCV